MVVAGSESLTATLRASAGQERVTAAEAAAAEATAAARVAVAQAHGAAEAVVQEAWCRTEQHQQRLAQSAARVLPAALARAQAAEKATANQQSSLFLFDRASASSSAIVPMTITGTSLPSPVPSASSTSTSSASTQPDRWGIPLPLPISQAQQAAVAQRTAALPPALPQRASTGDLREPAAPTASEHAQQLTQQVSMHLSTLHGCRSSLQVRAWLSCAPPHTAG
jgi:hypothetical protein